MLFTNVFTYTFALAAAVPMVAADYPWDTKLQIYKIGDVPSAGPKQPARAAEWMGRCGGDDIQEGEYGCGNFKAYGSGIYKCVRYKDDGYWLKRHEVCLWANGTGGQCVRNQRKKGAKYYPFVSGKKMVCVQPTDV